MSIRILTCVMMFLVSILLPAWGVLVVSLAGLILFDRFYEAIFAGVWFDLLYGSSALATTSTFYLTFVTIVMFVIVGILKQVIYTHAQI